MRAARAWQSVHPAGAWQFRQTRAEEFQQAMNGWQYVPPARNLRLMQSTAAAPDDSALQAFVVSEQYDYSRSTEENYAATSAADGEAVGEFKDHRNTLDYNYHSRYTAMRQQLQDDILRPMLQTLVQDAKSDKTCENPRSPWMVFT